MNRIHRYILLALLAVAGNGCATSFKAPTSLDAYYKSAPTPPAGMGRVYVLGPIIDTDMLGELRAGMQVYIGRKSGECVKSSFSNRNNYTAFDIDYSKIYIGSSCDNVDLYTIDAGQVIFIRYHNKLKPNGGILFGAVGAMVTEAAKGDEKNEPHKPVVEVLDEKSGMELVRSMSLVSIYPEARSLVRQGDVNATSGNLMPSAESPR